MLFLAYFGGVLTIVSPCILPVLPFVFSRADRPFLRYGLPLLAGMAVAFAAVGSLAAAVGGWAVETNRLARDAALVLLGLFGLTLLVPALADRLTRPLVALGGRLAAAAGNAEGRRGQGVASSALLGVATGLLWAPCAGPILGLILGTAALQGAGARTSLLLLAYALGAITSLALALLAGGRVFAAMKRSLHAGEWLRRVLGAAVLAAVVAIGFGMDTGLLTRISLAGTTRIEQFLVDRVGATPEVASAPVLAGTDAAGGGAMMSGAPGGAVMSGGPAMMSAGAGSGPAMTAGGTMSGNAVMNGGAMTSSGAMAGGGAMSGRAMAGTGAMMSGGAMAAGGAMAGTGAMMNGGAVTQAGERPAALSVENIMPSLASAGPWFNSAPLTMQGLRGRVVVIDFWTYSCINCLRALPYVRAWADRYSKLGLVVIGVHTPEFAFEKSADNVRGAVKQLHLDYPVVMDNDYSIWRAFGNRFWPAHYFIDAQGRVRYHHFGEGGYEESERVIRQLLAEAGHSAPEGIASVDAKGVSAAADTSDVFSPETYVGYERAENFVSPGGAVQDAPHSYTDGDPRLNEWGLTGEWTVGPERATLGRAGGGIVFRFHARDLHLVLGPGAAGRRIRFRVTLDGAAPGADHGIDVNAQGEGVVDGERLFQLIRQQGAVRDRRFEIRFLDPGVQAYSFTFG